MSFTLDPEVAEALAPGRQHPAPAGDVAARGVTLEGIFLYADTAQPYPDDVTITSHKLTTSNGATIPLRWYARKDAPGEPWEEIDARSLPEPRTRIRQDHARRVEIRPGGPEHMSI
jgi:hypothetical protein